MKSEAFVVCRACSHRGGQDTKYLVPSRLYICGPLRHGGGGWGSLIIEWCRFTSTLSAEAFSQAHTCSQNGHSRVGMSLCHDLEYPQKCLGTVCYVGTTPLKWTFKQTKSGLHLVTTTTDDARPSQPSTSTNSSQSTTYIFQAQAII